MLHPTDRITHTTAFDTPVVEHWLKCEIAQVYQWYKEFIQLGHWILPIIWPAFKKQQLKTKTKTKQTNNIKHTTIYILLNHLLFTK